VFKSNLRLRSDVDELYVRLLLCGAGKVDKRNSPGSDKKLNFTKDPNKGSGINPNTSSLSGLSAAAVRN